MQIGEFAKVCNTRISVLRHYDKEGLLRPDYIDRFTGYRYYSKEQIADFLKITVLKSAGFSLSEIKSIIAERMSDENIISLFEMKKEELRETFSHLEEARKMLLGAHPQDRVEFLREALGTVAKCSRLEPSEWDSACDALERAIAAEGYQRLSVYRMEADPKDGGLKVFCDVIKLSDNMRKLSEDTALPFEDDAQVIGKWEAVGEFAVREDFYSGIFKTDHNCSGTFKTDHNKHRILNTIYFLPGGEPYWCYGWTRGKLIITRGGGDTSVNSYTVEKWHGENYMFVDLKSYNYRRGGRTTVLVLRQLDNRAYTQEEIAHRDNTDMPFENDPAVLGKWRSCGFCEEIEDFSPENSRCGIWFFDTIEFLEGGKSKSFYLTGNNIEVQDGECWTRGYLLRKWIKTACAYEILKIDGKEYLFLEWKSGDYIYGGFDPYYYVFERSEAL